MRVFIFFLIFGLWRGAGDVTAQSWSRSGWGESSLSSARAGELPIETEVWLDGDRELYRAGDPLQIRFRVSDDAYVAVVNLAPDGSLHLLYPTDSWDDDYVRGGRVYTLNPRSSSSRWSRRDAEGIGYVYVLASADPLDLRLFDRYSFSRSGGSGPLIRGDPFWVFERLTAELLPDWHYTPFAVDYSHYFFGRRSAYPAYACYERAPLSGSFLWDAPYSSCERVVLLLRDHPGYYDTRGYRGDRRAYWGELARDLPRHRFKEPGIVEERGYAPPLRGRDVDPRRMVPEQTRPGVGRDVERRAPALVRPADPQRPTTRSRPRLERRPPQRATDRPRVVRPSREQPRGVETRGARPQIRPTPERPNSASPPRVRPTVERPNSASPPRVRSSRRNPTSGRPHA